MSTPPVYFSYQNLKLRYEPFPIGLIRPLMDESLYERLLDNYPPVELFESHQEYGKDDIKFALSEKLNAARYYGFIKSSPTWRDFHGWVTKGSFVREALLALKQNDIDLDYECQAWRQRLTARLKNLRKGRLCAHPPPLKARFEFSALPANGGMVVPHTDARRKLVTFVISMVREGEWDTRHGGGLDINRPRNPRLNYNQINRHAGFEDMEVIDTYEFMPNQGVLFIKTFNSWHSVRPMSGTDSTALRKTLTINILKPY
jgi:hypothetical protein